jgi:hypothetical protein
MYGLSWNSLVYVVKYAYILVVHLVYVVGQVHWGRNGGAAVCVQVLATEEAAQIVVRGVGLEDDLEKVELHDWLLDMSVGGTSTGEQVRRLSEH